MAAGGSAVASWGPASQPAAGRAARRPPVCRPAG